MISHEDSFSRNKWVKSWITVSPITISNRHRPEETREVIPSLELTPDSLCGSLYAQMFSLSSRRDNAVRYAVCHYRGTTVVTEYTRQQIRGLIWLSRSSCLLSSRRFLAGQVPDPVSLRGTGGMSTWWGTLSENVIGLIDITNAGALEVPLSLDWDLN